MGSGGFKIRNQSAVHFITFSVVKWQKALQNDYFKELIIESLKYCQENKGLNIHAWVIMYDHVHFILSAKNGFLLSNIIRDMKKHTSVKILLALENMFSHPNQNSPVSKETSETMLQIFKRKGKLNPRNVTYQFWQQNNKPIELTSNKMTDNILEYIHYNPVKAGYFDNPEDYPYSSAIDYSGEEGKLKIEFLD